MKLICQYFAISLDFDGSSLIEEYMLSSGRNTRRTIMESYLSLGLEKGYLSVSAQDVAERTGIKKSSLFYHFKTFSDLKNSAISFVLKELSKNEFVLDIQKKSLKDLIKSFFDSLADVFTVYPASTLMVISEECKCSEPEYLNLSKRLDLMISSRLTVVLDFALQRGWIDVNNTDGYAHVLTPYIKKLLLSFIIDNDYSEDDFSDDVENFVGVLIG